MTVWLLHLKLTPVQEALIDERRALPLPFAGVPDLSNIRSNGQLRQLLQMLHPDDPPETILRKADRLWLQYECLAREDIIAVPLPGKKQLMIAEVTRPYVYGVGEDGMDQHHVEVAWHKKPVAFRTFRNEKHLLTPQDGNVFFEIEDPQLRTAIRSRLPHSYNRFAGVKWILGICVLIQAMMFLSGLLSGQ
jgi:predicted Mrr-cat superfamily restriction endonuclease